MAQQGEPLPPEAPPPEEASNRMFIVLALVLGAIFLLGLLSIGAYAVLVIPRLQHTQQTQVAAVFAQNTQIVAQNTKTAGDMTQAALSAAGTQSAADASATVLALPPTATASSSPTPVVAPTNTNTPLPTNTPQPTNTLSPAQQTAAATQRLSGGDTTTTPGTPGSATATTQAGASGSSTPTVRPSPTRLPSRTPSPALVLQVTTTGTPGTEVPGPTSTLAPTALPTTGFGDTTNISGLLILALALIGVVIIVRRVRLSLR